MTEKPGDRIGRYKLLQEIGDVGFGVVYMAEQEEPVRRRVALKIMRQSNVLSVLRTFMNHTKNKWSGGLVLWAAAIVMTSPALLAQQLYWSQFGSQIGRVSQVGYVNLDGSGPVTFVQHNQVFGMETLNATRQVYWIDAEAGAILRANADFSSVTTLVTGLGGGTHLNLALDPSANLIFWSNADAGTIGRANLGGGSILGTFTSPSTYPDDLAVDAANQWLYWTTQAGEVIRSHYDGSGQVTLLSGSVFGASGLALDLTAGRMYLAIPNAYRISRANLDGSGLQTVLSTTERPFGMELFNGRMYWTDLDGGRLRSANLDGSDPTTILSGLTYPRQVRILVSTPPVITCPTNFSVQCITNVPPCPTSLAAFRTLGGTASDNCDSNLTYTCMDGPLIGGICGGNIARTHTVIDDCSNAASCVQIITVHDTIPPVITCQPDRTLEWVTGSVPVFGNPTASDTCDTNVTVTFVDGELPANCPVVRIFRRTWTATDDCTNQASCSQTIMYVDTTPPVLAGVPADQSFQCRSDMPPPAIVSATDSCDTNVTLFLVSTTNGTNPTIITSTWTGRDRCSNTVSATRTITFLDTMPPQITCPADITVVDDTCNGEVVTWDLQATDNCGIAGQGCTPMRGSIFPPGTTTVNCFVRDAAGRQASCSFKVKVLCPPTARILATPLFYYPPFLSHLALISCNGSNSALTLDGSLSSDPETPNSGLTFRWFDEPSALPFATTEVVSNAVFARGPHTLRLLVTDPDGLSDTDELTVDTITICEAIEALMADINSSTLDRKNKRPFLASLKAACASFDRGSLGSGKNQLAAFMNKVQSQIARDNPVEAQRFINKAKAILQAVDCG